MDPFPGYKKEYYWKRIFGFEPDICPEIEKSRAIVEFKGFLFFGCCHSFGLQIFRTEDGDIFQQCVGPNANTPAGFGNIGTAGTDSDVYSMIVFDDTLYVSTKYSIWFSQDGDNWKQVIDPGFPTIEHLVSFAGYIYGSSGIRKTIWRGKGLNGWECVVGDQLPAIIKSGFGDSDVTDIDSLVVFNGRLYASAGLDNPNGTSGITIWRTTDGKNWEQFKKLIDDETTSLHAHSMAVFNGRLYIGGYHGLQVFQSDGIINGSWIDITDGIDTGGGNDGVWSMRLCDGKLYLGVIGALNGQILWVNNGNINWSVVNTEDVGIDKNIVDEVAFFKDCLYITTRRQFWGAQSPSTTILSWNKLEIWKYCWRWRRIPPFKPWLILKVIFRILLRPFNPAIKNGKNNFNKPK